MLFLTKGCGVMSRKKYMELIEKRIDEMESGTVFYI